MGAEIIRQNKRLEIISYMESVRLGEVFHFIPSCPSLPRLSLSHLLYTSCPAARKAGQWIMGASGILLFPSWFPDKKKSFPSSGEETKYSGCSEGNLEDIPDDIMNATKSLVFKKEEETERINNEKQMKDMMANLQKQQNEILRLLRPFAEEN